ncbi:MAG: class I SAM-dependent methyltransferase [Emcibacter sp.]|nr:class I SAM-dependent methyltransferase [Emcibacter sp.]
MAAFKDHFSKKSGDYSKFRPSYPPELYLYLSQICADHDTAWDCATGTGQAARGLADYFNCIVATDASEKQIANVSGPDHIFFRVAAAEKSSISSSTVDLVVVAQALHWFAHDGFYQEVKRVLKPDGIFVAWTYNLLVISPEIDRIIEKLNTDIVGEYWPSERQLVNDNYRTIDFPFQEITIPSFAMETEWSLEHLMGYLGTWSSVARYRAAKGQDPLQDIMADLSVIWGCPKDTKRIKWPLSFRAGRC